MINDFPAIELKQDEIIFVDGDYLKVPDVYKQKKKSITQFYISIFNKSKDILTFGLDPLGFNYVFCKNLCYIGLIVEGDKKIEPSRKMKLKYPEAIFLKSYIINHIYKDLKFRNYEEFVPIDIVTKNIHELRNLNSKIASNIDDLLEINEENEWETKFEEANENVKKIYVGSRLIKFILDNLKFYNPNYLETLKIDNARSFTIHKSVLKIVKIFQNDFKKKKTSITLTGNSYKQINGDKELFEIILMLLIENAIKYSQDFHAIPPKVNIKENINSVDIIISSWGNIIPEEERDRLFTSGYRSTQNPQIPGTGMGLYNAKKIAKLFNALIVYDVDSGFKTFSNLGWNHFYLICKKVF